MAWSRKRKLGNRQNEEVAAIEDVEDTADGPTLRLSCATYASNKEIQEVLFELNRMKLDYMVQLPWKLESSPMCKECVLHLEGRKAFPDDSPLQVKRLQRVFPDGRSTRVLRKLFAQVYKLPAKGDLPKKRDEWHLEKYFESKDKKADGYPIDKCLNPKLRTILKVLNPIFLPRRSYQVSKKILVAVVKTWEYPAIEIDWARFLSDQFMGMTTSLLQGKKPCYISPYLFHVYSFLDLLSEAEAITFKVATKVSCLHIRPSEMRSNEEARPQPVSTATLTTLVKGTAAETSTLEVNPMVQYHPNEYSMTPSERASEFTDDQLQGLLAALPTPTAGSPLQLPWDLDQHADQCLERCLSFQVQQICGSTPQAPLEKSEIRQWRAESEDGLILFRSVAALSQPRGLLNEVSLDIKEGMDVGTSQFQHQLAPDRSLPQDTVIQCPTESQEHRSTWGEAERQAIYSNEEAGMLSSQMEIEQPLTREAIVQHASTATLLDLAGETNASCTLAQASSSLNPLSQHEASTLSQAPTSSSPVSKLQPSASVQALIGVSPLSQHRPSPSMQAPTSLSHLSQQSWTLVQASTGLSGTSQQQLTFVQDSTSGTLNHLFQQQSSTSAQTSMGLSLSSQRQPLTPVQAFTHLSPLSQRQRSIAGQASTSYLFQRLQSRVRDVTDLKNILECILKVLDKHQRQLNEKIEMLDFVRDNEEDVERALEHILALYRGQLKPQAPTSVELAFGKYYPCSFRGTYVPPPPDPFRGTYVPPKKVKLTVDCRLPRANIAMLTINQLFSWHEEVYIIKPEKEKKEEGPKKKPEPPTPVELVFGKYYPYSFRGTYVPPLPAKPDPAKGPQPPKRVELKVPPCCSICNDYIRSCLESVRGVKKDSIKQDIKKGKVTMKLTTATVDNVLLEIRKYNRKIRLWTADD